MTTCLMNVCARHDPRTCKQKKEKWYISCLLPSCLRMLLLCIRMPPMYSYITRILPYVSVNTLMRLVCTRMCSYVTRMYSHVTRMYSYATRMYSHVLVCTHMYSYVTRMLLVCTRMYSYVLICTRVVRI